MTTDEFKATLVKATAARFHKFISRTNASMEALLVEIKTGNVDETCPLERMAVQCMREFVAAGHAQKMREIAATAESLANRARVESLSMHDVRDLAGELADMLEQFDNERKSLMGLQEKLVTASKRHAELN